MACFSVVDANKTIICPPLLLADASNFRWQTVMIQQRLVEKNVKAIPFLLGVLSKLSITQSDKACEAN